MCGFTGYLLFNKKFNNSDNIIDMNNIIKHRGPDDEGYCLIDTTNNNYHFYSGNDSMLQIKKEKPAINNINFNHNLGFGFRRLSIIDLSYNGHQPMINQKKNKIITFNGEIYNHKEYIEFLKSQGYNFNSKTDTEVLLNLYDYYGINIFDKLNGMFAFAIYDFNKKNIILARDRFGIKPLYYYYDNDKLIFSSEIKSITQFKGLNLKINKKAIYNYLTYRFITAEETIYEKIYKVLPGHYITINLENHKINKVQYWDLKFDKQNFTQKEIENNIYNYLEKSVEYRLVSDVPVGVFLSGGLDSTIIAYLMNQKIKDKVKAFTIGFEDKNYNEFEFAEQATKFLNVEHKTLVINDSDFWEGLKKSVFYFDEPVADPAAVALYYVSKLAKDNGMKVLMCGEGSDELFAGYTYWRMLKYNKNNFLFKLFDNSIITKLNENIFKSNFIRKLRMIYRLSNPRTATLLFTKEEKEKLIKNKLPKDILTDNYYLNCFSKPKNLLDKMLYTDIKTWMVDDLLMKADKMTMANSLELRVPFLDHNLSEFSFKFDSFFKIKNNISKYILKKSFDKKIPENLVYRKKMGFPVPWTKWIKQGKTNFVDGVLFDNNSEIQNYLDVKELKRIVNLHRTTNIDYCQSIGAILMLEHWLKFDKNLRKDK